MPQPPTTQDLHDRKAGRSFDDPSRPLGDDLLAPSSASSTAANGDFRSPEAQADTSHEGVAERAKVIGVLRKVEEFLATQNPGADDEAGLDRCFEFAVGRVGITIGEYHVLVKGDAELEALEARVKDAARQDFTA